MSTEGVSEGSKAIIGLPAPWGLFLWHAQHYRVLPGREFSDRQLKGPFKCWEHRHQFVPAGENESVLNDEIAYILPLSPLSDVVAGWFVRHRLKRMFASRHRTLLNDIWFWKMRPLPAEGHSTEKTKMRILVTGSTGLIGKELVEFLKMGGHEVFGLSRSRRSGQQFIQWDLTNPRPVDASLLLDGKPLDAVVHLAGEGIADKRWSEEQKRLLMKSRVDATSNLISGLKELGLKPRVFVSASGVGFYGNAGNVVLDESSPRGSGFLAELAGCWEEAAQAAAKELSSRCVQLRLSTVLSPRGGALKKMLLPFQLGVGGRLGNGRQWMSWIALDDVLYGIGWVLENEKLSGPVNLVSPQAVSNAEFTQTLARVLRRPAFLPAPAFALRLGLGEMAQELLLSSQRAQPVALENSGFQFRYANLEDALRHSLGR
ncbi:MAG: TIGR01777 family oxidoreductase [Silvanigrellaceae bacterium]